MEGLIALVVLVVLAVPLLLIAALVMISGLKARVTRLEDQLAQWQARGAFDAEASRAATGPTLDELIRGQPDTPETARPTPMTAATPTRGEPDTTPAAVSESPVHAEPSAAEPPVSTPTPRPVAAQTNWADPFGPPPLPSAGPPSPPQPPRPQPPRPPQPPREPPTPDPLTLAFRAMRRWFTEGNVPVKVGVLVLFAGVAALLKYATDQGWVRFPVELKMASIALVALVGLVFGWVQRDRRRLFGLSLQGGAIGVLLMVVFASFKMLDPPLLPAGAAFALSIALVAGCGVLAVRQHSLALAVLGILAGFLAPIWLSTGSGNHVALFGYYAVLNAGIFAIAWFRPWRALNLLGFVFTFAIGTLWGVLKYRSDQFATTEPFLLLFFAFYLLIPIFYARRRAAGRRDLVDGCLVFGTPLVAFALQAGLLRGERLSLAFCALGLAAIYAALAWWLRRREHFAALATPYALLAIGFATLSVPLALSAQATACVFALEGAAMVWLGLRQGRVLPQLSGAALQLLAAGSFLIGLGNLHRMPGASVPAVFNATFMGALLIALAGLASAWSYYRHGRDEADGTDRTVGIGHGTGLALPYYLWGLAWWLGNGINEINRFVADPQQLAAVLGFAALTGWLAAELHRRLAGAALAWTGAVALCAAVPVAWWIDQAHGQPFVGWALAAWAVYGVLGVRSLACLRDTDDGAPAFAHVGWLLAWTLALSLLLHDQSSARSGLADGWRAAATGLPWLITATLLLWREDWLAWPLRERYAQWRVPAQALFVVAIVGFAGAVLLMPGGSAPLPWLPLLNPLELLQLGAIVIAAQWLAHTAPADLRALRTPLLAAAGFVLLTTTTLRATHHWGGIAWDNSMLSTSLVQTSLTVVWSVLGVLGWVLGSRRGHRGLWLAGAVLMAVVLAKLVLIDRSHLGNLFGILSFLAYGLLCTAVGYFAPAPPRVHRVAEAET